MNMAKKTVKKIDNKKVAKMAVSEQIKQMFTELNMIALDGKDFGFTDGTLVLKGEKCDIQIKLITPKAGIERYEVLTDEEEEEEVVEVISTEPSTIDLGTIELEDELEQ